MFVFLFSVSVSSSVADPKRFDAGPDPTFHANADPDPNFLARARKNVYFQIFKGVWDKV